MCDPSFISITDSRFAHRIFVMFPLDTKCCRTFRDTCVGIVIIRIEFIQKTSCNTFQYSFIVLLFIFLQRSSWNHQWKKKNQCDLATIDQNNRTNENLSSFDRHRRSTHSIHRCFNGFLITMKTKEWKVLTEDEIRLEMILIKDE